MSNCRLFSKSMKFGKYHTYRNEKSIKIQKTKNYFQFICIFESTPKLVRACTRDKAGFTTCSKYAFHLSKMEVYRIEEEKKRNRRRKGLIDIFVFDKQMT